jgi:hypothetical protein
MEERTPSQLNQRSVQITPSTLGVKIMHTLFTVKQFAAKHTAFTEASLRHLIFYAETTGFHVCVRRIGRRVYILESEFFAWVEQQNTHTKTL